MNVPADPLLLWVLRGLGALPLVAYPFVLLASAMTLGTRDPNDPPAGLVVVKNVFAWGTVAYPLVYFGSLVLAGRAGRLGSSGAVVAWSALPLLYLLALVGLALVWGTLGRSR
ncbi:hypothetical protein V3W47_03155 [Deinococcus sp. YIM 134068]|uniref:hypothetical protein n=1 Tax=Deinococcus lichenicola TaxID=3118910 RepID=UPI002F9376CC